MHELVSIPYSPWSQKAKRALRHARIPFTLRGYLPTVSEPRLRWKLRKLRGQVTVPVLFPDDGPPVTDSFDIALWADARGDAGLFPDVAVVRRIDALAHQVQASGRIRTSRAVLRSRDALVASLPGFLVPTGPIGRWIGRDAARRLIRKYDPADRSDATHLAQMRSALAELEEIRGGRPFLIGDRLSYADITAAIGTAFVRPAAWQHLKPAAAEAWREPELEAAFSDLLDWRDAVLGASPTRAKI